MTPLYSLKPKPKTQMSVTPTKKQKATARIQLFYQRVPDANLEALGPRTCKSPLMP